MAAITLLLHPEVATVRNDFGAAEHDLRPGLPIWQPAQATEELDQPALRPAGWMMIGIAFVRK
ncbi:MAG: hypothetical protein JOZ81_09685 [Chloroflexi bacterium]|nr:hypothetical protein [Chloroflexota bacterium]